MAAAIVRDDAEALLREKVHLAVPRVGVEGPAVRKMITARAAPVLVVDLRAVLGGDRVHLLSSLPGLSGRCRQRKADSGRYRTPLINTLRRISST